MTVPTIYLREVLRASNTQFGQHSDHAAASFFRYDPLWPKVPVGRPA
jgi:hypothetical protein